MNFSNFALSAANQYLNYTFAKVSRLTVESRSVFFNRGAFSSDIKSLKKHGDVVIDTNTLKKFLGFATNRYRFEQVLALFHSASLNSDLAPVIKQFGKLCLANRVNAVYFGGVDYFEVAIFEKEARRVNASTIAIFHENYTVPFMLEQTRNLISSYPEMPSFSEVYAIGPQAKNLLDTLFDNVLPMSIPRFQYVEQCSDFEEDLLLIPFGGFEYFAPIAFSITYDFVVEIVNKHGIRPIIKHKNSTQMKQFLKIYGRSQQLRNVISPDASYLCGRSRLTICYNSLVYYEALARGHLIALPKFAEAQHGTICSQHFLTDDMYSAGVRIFATKEDLEKIIIEAAALQPKDRQQWRNYREALLRQNFFEASVTQSLL